MTLLAWNRACVSLIAFGFVLERAGVLMHVSSAHAGLTFLVGVSFTARGALSAAYSALQYRAVLRAMGPAALLPGYGTRWTLAVNWLVAGLGTATTVIILVGRRDVIALGAAQAGQPQVPGQRESSLHRTRI